MAPSVLIVRDMDETNWRLWQVGSFDLVVLIPGVLKIQ